MHRFGLMFLLSVVVGVFAEPSLRAEEKPTSFIDVQPAAKYDLKETVSKVFPDNHLAELPQGEQTLTDVKFKIGPRMIQLGSSMREADPEKVDMAVGRTFRTVHVLHGTQNGAPGNEGDPLFVKDGTIIGNYELHYADGSTESLPIVYGEDVRDWWNWDKSKEVKRGKLAWTGKNPTSAMYEIELRLYRSTWKNPKPDQMVKHITYSSTKEVAAPFCIAITVE